MTVKNSNWQNIQHYIWLMGGLLFLIIALVFWFMTDTKELVTQSKQIEETQLLIQPEKVAATTYLGGLTNQVRPLQLTARKVATGNHLAEFRGTKYIQANQRNWFIELFRVRNEDVIKSFLLNQTDRQNFIYFRLSGEEQIEQYVLGFGNFKNENEAKSQLNRLAIKLPSSVVPKAQSFEQYVDLVNDLGSEELVGSNKLYEVRLKSAPLPLIDESLIAKPKLDASGVDPAKTTTNTTVVRRDRAGNVVDINRSQSSVDQPVQKDAAKAAADKKMADNQISDPFN
ncbi:hypothetical protein [Acinetobacter sp. KS-LM10]|uniref:hypothetical protein n=1 Tax=Acinetobacter sp. KS-LM10 TaxID=3120518 RepID=UPI0030D58580